MILVMLDLSFLDTVDHKILLKRLCGHFGFEGNCNAISHIISLERVMSYNIPQGSNLGPDDYSDSLLQSEML